MVKGKVTKFIVVYGCDNTGKSTACENLNNIFKQYGIFSEVVHSCGPVSPIEQIAFMEEQTETNPNVEVKIFDRFPAIEEAVCGKVLRNVNKLHPYKKQCNEFIQRISLFIHCNPPHSIVENWGTREQMEGIKENYKKLIKGYKNIGNYFPLINNRKEEYDWTQSHEEGLYKILWKRGFLNEHYTC